MLIWTRRMKFSFMIRGRSLLQESLDLLQGVRALMNVNDIKKFETAMLLNLKKNNRKFISLTYDYGTDILNI